MEPLFWCVWCEGGGSPTVKHRDYAKAKSEAQRLARQNPGLRFVVLAAVLAYQKRDLDEVRFHTGYGPALAQTFDDDENIPF